MSDIAIKVENLSKSYLIGHNTTQGERYIALRDVIALSTKNLARKTLDMLQGKAIIQGDEVEEFWALENVSFEIKKGDCVGIIGRNGAGKSTLLKILSRITEPTRGRIQINGRIASLLEVGTGFHPELTGRENIFLNGAILGMTRRDIQGKFDEIIAFAEIEKFLDTPVKRYSSGMYVRLAFAVAAHLEPEILIVDEVLAVGDIQFQKKCLGKMKNVTSLGRTVLFVSHNMTAIEQLTTSAIMLAQGKIAQTGSTSNVISSYHNCSSLNQSIEFNVGDTPRKIQGNQKARFLHLRFDREYPVFNTDEDLSFTALVAAKDSATDVRISMTIFNNDGTPVGSCFGPGFLSIEPGVTYEIHVRLPHPSLAPGKYYCGLSIGCGNHIEGHVDFDVVLDTLGFEVRPPQGDEGTLAIWPRGWGALIFSPLQQQLISA